MIKLLKILLITTFLSVHLNSAEFSANQNKIYVIKGSIEVSAYGVTQIVESGEITFYGENLPPSVPRSFQNIDIQDIHLELEAPDDITHNHEDIIYTRTIQTPEKNFIAMGIIQ